MKIGFQGRIYYLSGSGPRATWGSIGADFFHGGAAPSGLTKVAGVRDCSIEAERGEVDASSRDSAPYELAIAAMIKVPVNFKMVWKPTDGGQLAILTAYLSPTPATVALAVLDDDKATVGATGWWADWTILKMSESQNMAEGMIVDVSIKPGDPASNVNIERVRVSA